MQKYKANIKNCFAHRNIARFVFLIFNLCFFILRFDFYIYFHASEISARRTYEADPAAVSFFNSSRSFLSSSMF